MIMLVLADELEGKGYKIAHYFNDGKSLSVSVNGGTNVIGVSLIDDGSIFLSSFHYTMSIKISDPELVAKIIDYIDERNADKL